MSKNNFHIKNGLSVNGQQVIDSTANGRFSFISANNVIVGGVNVTSKLVNSLDTQVIFNQANTATTLGQNAYNTANGANGLAAGAFSAANTNTTNITSVNQYASSAYATANGANGLAAGAFNTANGANGLAAGAFAAANTAVSGLSSKQNTLVSGSNIKSINGTSLLGSGNLVIEGGGGGGGATTSNAFITVSDATNYRDLGTPSAVSYTAASNTFYDGTIVMTSSNTNPSGANTGSSLTSSSNSYVQMTAYYYYAGNMNNQGVYPNNYWKNYQPLCFSRRTALPDSIKTALRKLKVGDKFTINFCALDSASVMDTFSLELKVAKVADDTINYYSYLGNQYPMSGPDIPGSVSSWSSSYYGYGQTLMIESPVIGGTSDASITLKGLKNGRAINTSYVNTNSDGKKMLFFYTLFTGDTTITGGRRGLVHVNIPNEYGTFVTLPANTYQRATYSANALFLNNGTVDISNPRISDAANGILIVSSNNITSSLDTTTQLQSYTGLNYSPILKLGNSIQLCEDPLNKKTLIFGDLSKTYGFQNLGPVNTQSFTTTQSSIDGGFRGQYSSYYNTALITLPQNSFHYNRQVGNGATSGIFWLVNPDELTYNTLKANGTNFNVSYTYSGVTRDLFLTTTNSGTSVNPSENRFYAYNYGWMGFNQNYIQAKLNYFYSGSTNTAASSFSTSYFSDYDDNNTNLKVVYNANVITLGTSSNTINWISTSFPNSNNYVNGYKFTAKQYDVANNNIITYLDANTYSNVQFTNSNIVTYSQTSPLATITDIANNIPTWIKTVNSSYATTTYGISYVLGFDGTSYGAPLIRQMNWDNVMTGGNYSYSVGYVYNNTESKDLDKDKGYWQAGAFQIQGGLGVNAGIWAKRLWANTSVESPKVTTTLLTTSNVSSGNVSSNYITVPKVYLVKADPHYANTVLLLLGNYSGGVIKDDSYANSTITMQGSAGAMVADTDVPTGATGYSVKVPSSTWWSFTNPLGKSFGSQDWTVETWIKTEWFYWGYYFLTTSDNQSQVRSDWPYYPYIQINGTNVMSGPYTQAVYDAFTNPANQWRHYAWSRVGNMFYLHIDGVMCASAFATDSYDTSALTFKCGYPNGWSVYDTRFYNYRVTIGNARYDANNFSISTSDMLSPYGTSTVDVIKDYIPNSVDLYGGIQFHNLNSAPANTVLQSTGGGYLYTANNKLYYMGPNTITLLANS